MMEIWSRDLMELDAQRESVPTTTPRRRGRPPSTSTNVTRRRRIGQECQQNSDCVNGNCVNNRCTRR